MRLLAGWRNKLLNALWRHGHPFLHPRRAQSPCWSPSQLWLPLAYTQRLQVPSSGVSSWIRSILNHFISFRTPPSDITMEKDQSRARSSIIHRISQLPLGGGVFIFSQCLAPIPPAPLCVFPSPLLPLSCFLFMFVCLCLFCFVLFLASLKF